VSHSSGFYAVAVADRGRLGIDLEPDGIVEGFALRALMRLAPPPFGQHDPRIRARATRAWTRLEALGKAAHIGLPSSAMLRGDLPLRRAIWCREIQRTVPFAGRWWSFVELNLHGNMMITLAYSNMVGDIPRTAASATSPDRER
jgi:hypothetical protein